MFFKKGIDLKKTKIALFLCDHASNYIQKNLKTLDFQIIFLRSPYAWDIGAKNFA